MRFSKYVRDKINFILAFIVYCILVGIYMNAMQVDKNVIVFIVIISTVFFISGFFTSYFIKNRYIRSMEKIMDNLQEKYLISEIIDKPRREENLAYYRILKKANKSMIENVNDVRRSKRDYKEYIESWVHEVKIPITSVKLLCENNRSQITNKIDEEVEEINNFVEQALFYARLDYVANDFMIRKINLENVIRNVIARNKRLMIQNDMKVELDNIDVNVFSDEKWLEFILNQIVINAIKYKRDNDSKVMFCAYVDKDDVFLEIVDNGVGIKSCEVERIFDKGFSGTNGRDNKRSTGIGLYLCKKLCEELNMEISADSEEGKYTKVVLKIVKCASKP